MNQQKKQYKKFNTGFTFIELIISITIIAILSMLWFISYNSYISVSRDSIRKSELSDIYTLLDSYKIKSPLPIPDNKIDIYSSWVLIWFQWYLSNSIITKLGFKGTGKDPLDKIYYTYYLTKNLRNSWIMWFLENNPNTSSYLNFQNYSLVNKVYAIDYYERYPYIFWKKIWIILDEKKAPIQENTTLQATWKIELNTLNSNYTAFFDNKTSISNTLYSMEVLYWTAITWIIWNDCEQYKEENNWELLRSWYYLINSNTWTSEQYCNMDTTTWSGVEKRIATCSWNLPINTYPTNWNTYIQTYDWFDWLPIISWGDNQTEWCDFNCYDWYNWNSIANSCLPIINWTCWFPNWFWAFSEPSWTSICALWTPTTVLWTWPYSWDCTWTNWWWNSNCSTLSVNYCMAWGYWDWCEVQ